MLRNGPYIPSFLSVFIITWYWNLSNAFCASTEMIMCFFLCSINMVYFINWFSCVEHWLYAGGKSHLVMVYNPLMYCWIQYANISLNTCISVFVRHICAILTFFFSDIFVWLWYQGDTGLKEWVRSAHSSSIFWKSLRSNSVNSSLNMWQN